MKSIYNLPLVKASSLGGLNDVNIVAPLDNQILVYDSNTGKWQNETSTSSAVNSVFGRVGNVIATEGDYSLNLLSDVSISAPSIGQILKHNGIRFENSNDYFQSFNVVAQDTIFNFNILYGSAPYDVNFSFLFQPVLPNRIFCGPSNLPSATPTFRSLQLTDLPTINLPNLGDTNINTPIDGQHLIYNSFSNKWINSSNYYVATVVGTQHPAFNITSSTSIAPYTTTINFSFSSQTQHKVLAGDLSNNGQVLFRNLDSTDLPAINLDFLSDVSINTPISGQVLKYNGTNFVNSSDYYNNFLIGSQNSIFNFNLTTSTAPYTVTFDYSLQNQTARTFLCGPNNGGPSTPTFRTVSIDEMNDVVITSPLNNQVLKYNGANWVNTDQNSSFIFYGSGTNITPNQYFQYGSMNANIEAANIVMPRNGRIINFVARLSVSPGLSSSRTFTIFKDGVSTGVSLVFTDASNSLAITTNITFSAYTKIAIFAQQVSAAASIGHCTLEYV